MLESPSVSRPTILRVHILRDNLLDADAEVDTDRRDIAAAEARLSDDMLRRADLQLQLETAIAEMRGAA